LGSQHYTAAEETFLRSKISDLLQKGYGTLKISETLKVPKATVSDRVKKLRLEALSRHEEYYQSLPLELENSLQNLSDVWVMALELYNNPNAKMSYASRINLIATLKNMVETRIAIISDMNIIKDIAQYTELQRARLEKLQKQSVNEVESESKTIDEMMAADQTSIKDLAIAAASNQNKQNKQKEQQQESELKLESEVSEVSEEDKEPTDDDEPTDNESE
jgi:hypothetical protein